jgi:hypothetical protein
LEEGGEGEGGGGIMLFHNFIVFYHSKFFI